MLSAWDFIKKWAGAAELATHPATAHLYDKRKLLEMFGAEAKELLKTADKREAVALWMMGHGYATGHGDSVEDMLCELEAQIIEQHK